MGNREKTNRSGHRLATPQIQACRMEEMDLPEVKLKRKKFGETPEDTD